MLTPERLAELDRVLIRLEDEEYERQRRAVIRYDQAQQKKAAQGPAPPPIERRWIVAVALPRTK